MATQKFGLGQIAPQPEAAAVWGSREEAHARGWRRASRGHLNWQEPAKDRLGSQPRHPTTGRAATQREPDRVAAPGRIHDGRASNDCPADVHP
jgi:hypothetical protein